MMAMYSLVAKWTFALSCIYPRYPYCNQELVYLLMYLRKVRVCAKATPQPNLTLDLNFKSWYLEEQTMKHSSCPNTQYEFTTKLFKIQDVLILNLICIVKQIILYFNNMSRWKQQKLPHFFTEADLSDLLALWTPNHLLMLWISLPVRLSLVPLVNSLGTEVSSLLASSSCLGSCWVPPGPPLSSVLVKVSSSPVYYLINWILLPL